MMNSLNMPNNWTQNQKLVAAGLLSILVSVVSTTATAVVQSYTNSGLDIPVLVNVAVISFFPLLGAALLNYIPAHAVQLLAASEDTKAQLAQDLQGLQQQHNALIAAHNTLVATVQPVQPAPVAQPLPVQQAPVPPSQPVPIQVAQPVQQQPFPPQASSGYIDPLAMPRTAEMPVVAQVPFPLQTVTSPQP